MFKKSTVFISNPIRQRLEKRRSECRGNKGLWLAINLAYDVIRIGTVGVFTLQWPGMAQASEDYNRIHLYGHKFFDGVHSESRILGEAIQRAARIEAHVCDFTDMATETRVSFYDVSCKDPFAVLHACFDISGKGGIISTERKL